MSNETSVVPPQSNTISFSAGAGTEILKLTKDGMYYKGEFIADAGAAHAAFMETMRLMQAQYNPLQ